ncbi:TIGR02391 family protein [Bradyrhizobium sp. CB2312]|uniref:TIGR02391 family protein n=1 Tax=Bradyrhizobium sp. CB2312 TaxID=3039155 RepID=UPI0024B112EC|nr:TIGR02391 family protein [Bradyrhizobium sp. CB2312]WFU71424.1 TIGR02391 family protein [Bradyrhizobium sp. CB2312]
MTTSKSAAARHLSPKRLHPRLGEAWRSFKHEDYGAGVFLAMKAVEVAVRDAAGMSPSDLGMSLMRKAFNVFAGPLSDYSAESAERQARSDLFAGAIGSYKNPHSHRDVLLDNPAEVAEIMMFANHLLRIVDASAARTFASITSQPLTPQEERILRMWFTIDMNDGRSLKEIGLQFGLAPREVQKIIHKAMRELKHRSVYNQLIAAC